MNQFNADLELSNPETQQGFAPPSIERRERILAINFGGIGDEILFLPTLDTLRKQFPTAVITLLLEPRSRSVGQITDLVDHVITFDIKKRPLLMGDLLELLGLLKDGGYDRVVSSGGSLPVSLLLFFSGIPIRIGYGTTTLGRLLLTHPVELNKNQYAGNMYHDLALGAIRSVDKAKRLGKETLTSEHGESIPSVTVKSDSIEKMREMLASKGCKSSDQLILIHPGTSKLAHEKGIIKTWNSDNWKKLIQLIEGAESLKTGAPTRIILAGGPDDGEIIADLCASLHKESVPFVSTYGDTASLADLAALMFLSELIICVDSAPMHVAVALQKKVVALFGPTNPALLIPDTPNFKPVWDKRDGNRSMFDGLGVEIEPEEVFQRVRELL